MFFSRFTVSAVASFDLADYLAFSQVAVACFKILYGGWQLRRQFTASEDPNDPDNLPGEGKLLAYSTFSSATAATGAPVSARLVATGASPTAFVALASDLPASTTAPGTSGIVCRHCKFVIPDLGTAAGAASSFKYCPACAAPLS